MPPVDPTYASGVTFVFDGDTYTATQISVSRSATEIDCTSTADAASGRRRYRTGDIESCDIKVDWVGLTIPAVDKTAAFSVGAAMGATGSNALCTGLTITATAGDLIKGSATFKVSYD